MPTKIQGVKEITHQINDDVIAIATMIAQWELSIRLIGGFSLGKTCTKSILIHFNVQLGLHNTTNFL